MLARRAVVALAALALAGAACRDARRAAPDASPAAAPERADAGDDARLAREVDEFVSAFGASWGDAHAAHGVVAVARGGEIVFARAYGMSAGLDTRFAIGSVTKTLTAAAVLRLVDAKKLALADPVRRYVPELAAAGAEKITLEDLLTHTSGLASYTDEPDVMRARDAPRTTASVLARIAARPLASPAGARFRYSSSNYFVLGVVLERVLGEPYESALRRLILEPAGMTRTALEGAARAPGAMDDADGRTVDGDDRLIPAPPANAGLTFAASGLRSTARDLLAFDRALSGALLSDAARVQMETPRKGAYACGWECWREAGVAITSHEGAVDGFSAFFGRAPAAGVAVVVLLAVDAFEGDRLEAGAIGEPVLAMALGERVSPPRETAIAPLDATRADAIAGEWELARVTPGAAEPERAREVPAPPRVAVARDADRVWMSPDGEPRVRLYQAADGSFFPKQLGVRVALRAPDASGDAELALLRFGREMVYRRPAPHSKKAR